jgi:hypothetical protein
MYREATMDFVRPTGYYAVASILFAAVAGGCASQQQTVEAMQPQATQAAQQKGSFELNCPAATAQVLSKEMSQTAAVEGPRYLPPERAEYTVGVEGCGKRATYTVICAQGGTGCFAATGQGEVRSN